MATNKNDLNKHSDAFVELGKIINLLESVEEPAIQTVVLTNKLREVHSELRAFALKFYLNAEGNNGN